jgi:hypothetical protein
MRAFLFGVMSADRVHGSESRQPVRMAMQAITIVITQPIHVLVSDLPKI